MESFFGGDFRFFYPENIKDFTAFPFAWDSSLNTGIGHSQIGSLWIISYFNFTVFLSKLGLSWNLIQLIFWVLPAILLSFFSSFYLFKTLFNFKDRYSILAGIIYTLNTYFLMILTGGQLGVSLSYSIAPLIVLVFIRLVEKPSLRNALISGLILGFQIIFDPRIVYITLVTTFFYSVFNFSDIKRVIKNSPVFFASPLIIAILMNIFWILPLILTKSSPIPEGFNSVGSFKFFSFADFSHSLSLLHPNWPENIFGKIYFLQPEFIILPVLAYLSLTFLAKQNRTILFFAVLGLLGAFLAKGANPPFEGINIWLFQYFPGMFVLRDSTKWYILIALSYSVLIPFSVCSLYSWFKSKLHLKNYLQNIFLLFFTFYLLLLIRPLWMGELREELTPREVSKEYVQLKDFLVSQPEFFRTLWIPQWQRFGYFSNNHPAIGREEIFKGNAKKQINQLKQINAKRILKELSVKYVIVPYDSEGEIFLKDRKYDAKQRIEVEEALDQVPWLAKVRFNDLNHLSKIAVYEIKGSKDRFWSPSTSLRINYSFISPTKYKINVENAKKEDVLVFSEGFDKNWAASSRIISINSKSFNGLNSFALPKEGDYTLEVFYTPQRYVGAGLGVSILTLLGSAAFLAFGKIKKKW